MYTLVDWESLKNFQPIVSKGSRLPSVFTASQLCSEVIDPHNSQRLSIYSLAITILDLEKKTKNNKVYHMSGVSLEKKCILIHSYSYWKFITEICLDFPRIWMELWLFSTCVVINKAITWSWLLLIILFGQ